MKLLILCPLALFFISCNRQTVVLEKNVTPVRLSEVQMYRPTEGQRYSASILPNRQVNLAFKVNGFVQSIYQVAGSKGRPAHTVDIGDVVERGTTLAELRAKDYQLQVSQAEGQVMQARDAGQTALAQVAQAQAAAEKAELDFERADTLFKKSSLTKSDYDAAKANRDSTRAQVAAAEAQVQANQGTRDTAQAGLGTATLGLQDSKIAAPFTAAVVQRSVEVGTLAGPGMAAFVLADISAVKATFAVSDISVPDLRTGSRETIYAEAFPSRRFEGFVSAVAAVADTTTRGFQVEVTIPNAHAMLRPGMIATLDAGGLQRARPVTVAPLSSIVRYGSGSPQFAVVIVEDGVAQRKAVSLGSTYGDRIEVTGIDAGRKVVSSGATFINDGDAVRVIP